MAHLLPSDPPVIRDHPALRDWLKRLLECLKGKLFKAPAGTGYIHITDGVMDDPAQPIPPTSLPDGVYGDVTVGGGGTNIQINPDAVGSAEIAPNAVQDSDLRDSNPLSVIGRSVNSIGDPTDIIAAAGSGHYLRESGGVLGFGALPAVPGIPPNSITNIELRDSSPLSVIGRPVNSIGDPSDISTPSGSGHVLQESGGTLVFAPAPIGAPAPNSITNAMLRDSAALSVLGRSVNSIGDPADIVAAVDGTVLQRLGTIIGFFGLSGGQLGDATIDYIKIVPQPAVTLLGRGDAGAGPPEVITLGAMLQIIGTELQVLFPSLSIPNNFVTNAMLRDSAALSVLGRSVNSIGDPADIATAAGSGHYLRESGGVLGFGALPAVSVPADSVTDATLRNSAGLSVIGRSVNSVGDPADIIAAAASNTVLRESAGVIGWGLVGTNNLVDGSVSGVKFRASVGLSIVGRSVNTIGAVGDIVATAGGNEVLRESGSLLGWGLLTAANLAAAAGISLGQLVNGAALSIVGRSANSIGPHADIAATAASNAVLRESGSVIGWGLLVNANIDPAAGIVKTKIENSVALSVVGRGVNSTGPVADIATTAGSFGVLRENGIGNLLWGPLGNSNIAPTAGINKSKLENSVGCSVVGRSVNSAGSPADIVAGADNTFLTRKAGVVAFTAPSASFPLYQKVYDTPAYWGEHPTAAPTLVLTNPTGFTLTSASNHFVGFLMGGTMLTWLRFGFGLPANVSAGAAIIPRICFVLNGAPAAGNLVEFVITGILFNDNDSSAAGTPFFSGTSVLLTGYAAGDYVIVDMTALATSFSPGQYFQGVIGRDARAGNANDTYADLIGISWVSFRGTPVVL